MTPPAPPAPPSLECSAGPRHPVRAVAVVALLVVLGLTAAYGVSEAVAPVYAASREEYRRAVAAGPAVQALSLGNSHGRALALEVLGLHGADLRSPGGDYYEALHYTRSLRPHLPNLEYVFVTVSLFASDNSTEPSRREVRKEAYVATGNYTPVAGDRDVAFQAMLAPVIRADNWQGVPARLVRQLRGGGRDGTGEGSSRRDRRRRAAAARSSAVPVDEIRRSAVRKAAVHGEWQALSLAENPRLCEEAREALREIARLSAPARLVLYTPPYPLTYLRHYDAAGGCHLDRFATELAASAPNVTYFDDRAMAGFTDGSGLFRDGDHVNVDGARRYSAVLAERLGLPGPPAPGAGGGHR